ncbi:hypothetical protein AGQ53_22320 [Salmonella enterica subsp. enterica]|nr:hypothetical protein AGQ53_22320 [Salmonella enterica subsp. enterica]
MRFKYADRFARLNKQRFVRLQPGERINNSVIAFPVARGATNPAVDHQLMRIFRHVRIEIIH